MALCESQLDSVMQINGTESSVEQNSPDKKIMEPNGDIYGLDKVPPLPLSVDYRSPVSHFVPPAVELYAARHKPEPNVVPATSETPPPQKRKRGRPRIDKTSPEYLANLAARKQAREMAAVMNNRPDSSAEKRKRGRPRVDKTSPEYLARKRAREIEALEKKAKREYRRRTTGAKVVKNNNTTGRVKKVTVAKIGTIRKNTQKIPVRKAGDKKMIIRRNAKFLKRKDEDFDDAGSNIWCHGSRYRPEPPEALARASHFTEHEIKLMYRGFKQECPTGVVDEEAFKNIFSQFFPLGDATQYAHFVFNTVKHKQTGKLNFEEFLDTLSRVARGSRQEKLSWVFALYDVDGDGRISRSEMLAVVRAVYELLGRAAVPPIHKAAAEDHVDRIFHLMDTNADGVVTPDELARWCARDPALLRSLDTLDTVL